MGRLDVHTYINMVEQPEFSQLSDFGASTWQ